MSLVLLEVVCQKVEQVEEKTTSRKYEGENSFAFEHANWIQVDWAVKKLFTSQKPTWAIVHWRSS